MTLSDEELNRCIDGHRRTGREEGARPWKVAFVAVVLVGLASWWVK